MRTSLVALVLGLLVPAAIAHPVHTSIADADYNRATKKLEVAVRVFADDFEAALSAVSGKKISLERTPPAEFDALALRYLRERFTVIPTGSNQPVSLTWVGRELKDAANVVWLYFEVPLPGGIEGARLRHALLGEVFPDQLNSVRVRAGTRQVTLLFPPGQAERAVTFPP